MLLVVDMNILFSFFKKHSTTRKLLTNPNLELYSPKYALEELSKHFDEQKGLRLSAKELSGNERLEELAQLISSDEITPSGIIHAKELLKKKSNTAANKAHQPTEI